jgi:hypothetical protein
MPEKPENKLDKVIRRSVREGWLTALEGAALYGAAEIAANYIQRHPESNEFAVLYGTRGVQNLISIMTVEDGAALAPQPDPDQSGPINDAVAGDRKNKPAGRM